MSTKKQGMSLVTGLLFMEGIAILIAVAMALVPGKTGSGRSIADYFFENPSFVEKVFVFYLLVSVVLLVLGAIAWGVIRARQGPL